MTDFAVIAAHLNTCYFAAKVDKVTNLTDHDIYV